MPDLTSLFDPERLRDLWVPRPLPPEPEPEAGAPSPAHAALARLEAVLRRDLPGGEAALAPLLKQVRTHVDAQSPGAPGEKPDEKAVAKSRAALDPLIDDLEDLVEALEIASP